MTAPATSRLDQARADMDAAQGKLVAALSEVLHGESGVISVKVRNPNAGDELLCRIDGDASRLASLSRDYKRTVVRWMKAEAASTARATAKAAKLRAQADALDSGVKS